MANKGGKGKGKFGWYESSQSQARGENTRAFESNLDSALRRKKIAASLIDEYRVIAESTSNTYEITTRDEKGIETGIVAIRSIGSRVTGLIFDSGWPEYQRVFADQDPKELARMYCVWRADNWREQASRPVEQILESDGRAVIVVTNENIPPGDISTYIQNRLQNPAS